MLFGGGLINSLTSLTRSPAQSAIALAHRAARRHLEAGGSAGDATSKRVNTRPADFVIPADLAHDVAAAIRVKLGGDGASQSGVVDPLYPLERRAGGRVVLPGSRFLRLGDGRYDLGRRYLQGIINQIRLTRPKMRRT
jgi:hypothetical protein